MYSSCVRVTAALLFACSAASGSAATNVNVGPSSTFLLPRPVALAARGAMRTVKTGTRKSFSVPTPPGCTVNGVRDFIGLTGLGNVAGGAASASGRGYAGVAAGDANLACDFNSFIGAGDNNVIGGDNGSIDATIVAGEYNSIFDGYHAFIGGGYGNIISTSVMGEGTASAIVNGWYNTVTTQNSFIGSGYGNAEIGDPGEYGENFIGSGYDNLIQNGTGSIGSGWNNMITGGYASIGSGFQNTVSGEYGSIGSGYGNTVSAKYASIGGGSTNSATNLSASIAGGNGNTASGRSSTVAGGYNNAATADSSAIPGGASNVARGIDSFAAGTGSHANTTGAFVWSDDSAGAAVLESTASNQFLARAAGGFYLYSSATLASGVSLAPGSGAWSTLSDRNAKTDVRSVDGQRILVKIASMPVSEWSYTAQGTAVRHLGPMAQDFRAAFGLGEDDRHISTVDEEGVALAAIKALQQAMHTEEIANNGEIAKLRADKDRQIADLRSADQARFAKLEKRLAALESRSARQPGAAGQ